MVDDINNQMAARPFAMAEVRPMIGPNEARLNITWGGTNADLPDPVRYDASDEEIKRWVVEAVRGGIPGITADPNVNLDNFVVDRFPANDTTPYNRLHVRPKVPFGGVGGPAPIASDCDVTAPWSPATSVQATGEDPTRKPGDDIVNANRDEYNAVMTNIEAELATYAQSESGIFAALEVTAAHAHEVGVTDPARFGVLAGIAFQRFLRKR